MIDASSGVIAGTPTTAGKYATTVTATDDDELAETASFTWTIGAGPAITDPGVQASIAGTPVATTIGATGGIAPYTWTVIGLPAVIALLTLRAGSRPGVDPPGRGAERSRQATFVTLGQNPPGPVYQTRTTGRGGVDSGPPLRTASDAEPPPWSRRKMTSATPLWS